MGNGASKKQTEKTLRLSQKITPTEYNVRLKPYFDSFTFDGEVEIKFDVHTSTLQSTVKLNVCNLDILMVRVNGMTAAWKLQSDDIISISAPKPLYKGGHRLHIVYRGQHGTDLRGFYRTKTGMKVNGKDEYALVSQFEPIATRQTIPCFDQPDMKAIFNVKLTVPNHLTALSNMPVSSDKMGYTGTTTYTFEPTPIMSPYLLAFCVGNYEFIESKTYTGLPIRIYAYKHQIKQCQFALDVAVKCLEFYEELFGIPYPLPKCDFVSTNDHSAAAMENWGLLVHRSTRILYSETESTFDTKLEVALCVAHELAHQWFGNLVTMEWWTDLWLNEGFAIFMEFTCIDAIFPEWNVFDNFFNHWYIPAMSLDGFESSHPIVCPINNPAETESAFDEITYGKGAALIRMVKHHIGDDAFKTGLNAYLKSFSYKNATTADLWSHWSTSSGIDIAKMMDPWINVAGFPLITVKIVSWTADGTLKLQVEQQKFPRCQKRDKTLPKNEPQSWQLWNVPLSYVTSNNPDKTKTHLLTCKKCHITIENIQKTSGWVQFNPNGVGYYIVLYLGEKRQKSIRRNTRKANRLTNGGTWGNYDALYHKLELRFSKLSTIDQQMMLRTQFLLAQHQQKAKCEYYVTSQNLTVRYIKLLKRLKGSTEYYVWHEALAGINGIKPIIHSILSAIEKDRLNKQKQLIEISPGVYRLGMETDGPVLEADEIQAVATLLSQFDRYLGDIAKPTIEQIGWTSQSGETGNVSLLRGDIATLLGSIGDPTALTYAKANLAVMLNLLPKRTGRKGPTKKIVDKKDRKRSKPLSANVDANMRSMILNTSAQNASSVADLITLYNHTINIEVKEDICRALGHVKIDKDGENKLLKDVLTFAFDDNRRVTEQFFILTALAASSPDNVGREVIWKTIKDQFDELKEFYGGSGMFESMVKRVLSGFTATEHEDDVRAFFRKHPFPEAKKQLNEAIASAKVNSTWVERDKETLLKLPKSILQIEQTIYL